MALEALNIMVLENRLHMIHGDIKEYAKYIRAWKI